jgi:hypothetical protein
MKPRTIEVYIEELVLHGFDLRDRYAIGEAVQRELSRLFAEQGIHSSLGQGREIARLDVGTFDVKPGAKAEAIGTQVAQSVYGGLKR